MSEVEVVDLHGRRARRPAAPEVTGEVSGTQDEDGHYLAPATVTIAATDALSAITSIEYRVNQADEWQTTEPTTATS